MKIKLYDDKTLLYHKFTHDIAKLDYNLSSEIYDFYNDLFKADKLWDNILEGENPSLKFDPRHPQHEITMFRYKEMNALINNCAECQKIREELKEFYES